MHFVVSVLYTFCCVGVFERCLACVACLLTPIVSVLPIFPRGQQCGNLNFVVSGVSFLCCAGVSRVGF